MTAPIWYDTGNELLDLTKLVGLERYCPAEMNRMFPRPDGEQTTFVMGRLPTPNRYGNSEVSLFAGTWPEANAELERIKRLLTGVSE